MPTTTGELLAVSLFAFGVVLLVFLVPAALLEKTEPGRRFVDWVDRRFG